MITRILEKQLKSHIGPGKIIFLIGPRQVGKTTLLKQVIQSLSTSTLTINCNEPDTHILFQSESSNLLKALIRNHELVIIDHAQRVKNICIHLNLIIGQMKNVRFIVSGSSPLKPTSEIKESLMSSQSDYTMFPLSYQEMADHHSVEEENKLLSHRLIYGMYPDVINQPGHEKEVLRNLTDRVLYKDLLSFHDVRKPEVMEKIIHALSLQMGSKISYNEIADLVNSDPATVSRYIDLLEESMLVFRLPSLGRNLKNEIKKSRKIYFYDNGIRNSIVTNYLAPEKRQDIGALWENFLVSERLKFIRYNNIPADRYFWRTKQQQEIDYIEELDGKLYAFDFRWEQTKKIKPSLTFTKAYPDNEYKVITPDNYTSFIST